MSVQTGPQSPRVPPAYAAADEEQGEGWITFAGVLLVTIGVLNAIEGIAAIGKAHFFVANAHYVFSDLKTWGWITLIVGAAQILVGLGIFARNQFARWTGVVVLGLDAIVVLLMMPAYPFWGLCIFAIDVVAMYGLVAHGKRIGMA